MLKLTKIFHFEMAHAIHGYQGACKNIHGHSYELHVTVCTRQDQDGYIPSPGFIIDFKQIKNLVTTTVIEKFDHRLVLSEDYLKEQGSDRSDENLVVWPMEPSAENLLLYIQKKISEKLPADVKLLQMRLYETKDSYAEWVDDSRTVI